MKNIYLSYTLGDEERAEELQRILLAQGHRPWLGSSAGAGQDQMEAGIARADALILLVTREAAASVEVTYEWAFALGAGIPVFAIIYEAAAEHPRLQTVARYDPGSFSDENHFWDHLVEGINRQLGRELARGQAEQQPRQDLFDLEIDKSVMPTEPGYWLVMRRGPLRDQLFRLERELVNIGRDLANDIVIRDGQVSRYHLRLNLRGQEYYLQDLGSSNGTRVNGVQLEGEILLNDGDLIALGDAILLSYDLVYLE